jgi:hypothetical protein
MKHAFKVTYGMSYESGLELDMMLIRTLSQHSIPIMRNRKKQAVLVTPCDNASHVPWRIITSYQPLAKVGNEQPSWHHPDYLYK